MLIMTRASRTRIRLTRGQIHALLSQHDFLMGHHKEGGAAVVFGLGSLKTKSFGYIVMR